MKIRDNQHWEYEDYKQRMTKKDWAKLLLNNEDRLIFKGRMRKLVAKDLGCGIVEITKEVKKEVEKPDTKTPIYTLAANGLPSYPAKGILTVENEDFNKFALKQLPIVMDFFKSLWHSQERGKMEINILVGNISDKDKELFFSPMNGDKFIKLDNSTTWADILVPVVFKSRSQCRKAGFTEIDEGFTDILVGKKRVRVTILKERSI